jgi:hypothetical protein
MALRPEPDELRDLQRKAYGRHGGLTDAEATRLRELEDAAAPDTPSPVPERPSSGPARSEIAESHDPHDPVPERPSSRSARSGTEAQQRDEGPRDPVAEGPSSHSARSGTAGQDAQETTDSSWRATLRRHWKAAAAASALLLVVGIGAGWALFAPRVHDAVALSDDEVQRRLELDETESFDEGTLHAVARDEDALVWFGTKDGGEQYCIVLDVDGQSQTGCSSPDQLDFWGLNASVSLPPEDENDPNDYGGAINAYAMMSTTGEPMVALQRWDYDSSMLDQFDDEERERAEALIEEGFQMGPSLVGYVRDQPVWVADRFTDSGGVEKCLVVDAFEATGCDEDSAALEDGLNVGYEGTDGRRVLVSVQFTRWGTPYLTVTEDVGGASSAVIDTETGDPIEVTTPQTDPDG